MAVRKKIKPTSTTKRVSARRTGRSRHQQKQLAAGVLVNVVLDQSGSMMAVKGQAISGYNEYLQTLKQQGGEVTVNLTRFNTQVFANPPVALDKAMPLTEQNYQPNGMTALYDAVHICAGLAEAWVEARPKYKVLFVILTDGQENSSREHNQKDTAELVERLTKTGRWTFVYLGANQDAWANAAPMGIPMANTMSYDQANTVGTFRALGAATMSYTDVPVMASTDFFGPQGQRATVPEPPPSAYGPRRRKPRPRI